MPVSPIWPAGSAVNDEGEITFHGRTAASLLDEFGSPLYVIDTDDVRARADEMLSFGRITLPHNLARVVLLEQIYRACKISRGEPYHK